MSNAKYLQPSGPENVLESGTCGGEADFPFWTCSEGERLGNSESLGGQIPLDSRATYWYRSGTFFL